MKTAIILLACLAAALAAPQFQPRQAFVKQVVVEKVVPYTVSEYNEKNPDGSYRYGYELSDGTRKQEEGIPHLVGDEIRVFSKGVYSYIDPEGQIHERQYYTDEAGFHVQGNDVPTPTGK